jgi:hypothetical protein
VGAPAHLGGCVDRGLRGALGAERRHMKGTQCAALSLHDAAPHFSAR